MKRILYTFILLIPVLQLQGQKTLEGKVLDTDGKTGLAGASVYWAGTTSGTSSNEAGYFVLKHEKMRGNIPLSRESGTSPFKGGALVISFVGYMTDTVLIDSDTEYYEHSLTQLAEIAEVTVVGRAAGAHIDRKEPLMTSNITGHELTKAACCNLSESFTSSASVDVSYSDAATGAKQIELLGLAGTYVQMMTENFPALYGLGSAYGLNYIPGSWMESIQVSKGSASVRNGYEAISGQINVEYKKPVESEKFFLNAYANSKGKMEGNVNASLLLNDKISTALFGHAEYNGMISDHNNDGFRDEPNVKQYHFFNRWEYMTEHIHAKAGVKVMEEERVGGQTGFTSSGLENNGSDYGILINTMRAEAFTKTGYIFPSAKNMSLAWINSITFHDQEALFGINNYSGRQKSYYGNILFQWKPISEKHTLDAGLSYKYDQYNEIFNTSPIDRKESVPGGFLQYTYTDTSLITLVAGIRVDDHNLYGLFVTPRIHLRYELADKTTLRGSAGKGFRSTNVLAENQYLLASSRETEIADDLEHEEAWNAGLSLTSYYSLAGRELRLSAEYYHTSFISQIVIDLDRDVNRVLFYMLDGKSFSNVIQMEAQWEPVARLDLLTAFRWNDVRVTTAGELQQRALTSRYKGLLSLSYQSYLRKWQYDLTLQLNGPGRIPSTAENPMEYRREESFNPYALLNGQVSRKFKYFEIYAGMENITNYRQEEPVIAASDPFGEYFDAGLVWGPVMGRMIYGGIRLTFNRIH
ncbi:MAG: TonB-dependent receptor [Bacteroidales bacterium]|nr:TonB-dependent receptor [Bacteroidales bacterium]